MGLSLYSLSEQYNKAFYELIDNLEIDEQAFLDTMEAIEGEIKLKAQNVGAFFLNIEAEISAIKEAENKMQARRKWLQKKSEQLKFYLKSNMERCAILEIKSPEFSIKLANNPSSLIVDNEDVIDAEYFEIETVKTLNKNKVKQALKDGLTIEGVHLEHSKRLVIK